MDYRAREQAAALRERLAGVELLRSLSPEALDAVRAAMRIERVAKGKVICAQGEAVDRAYALGTGSVRIVQTGSDGGEAIVRFIGPGEMFGAAHLFTDRRFPADAIAVEASTVFSWSGADLLALMARHGAISTNMIRILGNRIAQLQERVRELTTLRAEPRLAQAILRLAAQAGRDGLRGTTIEMPLRRKDIAAFAGITLYTASRLLSAWQKAGFLASRHGRLTLFDLAAIRDMAAGHQGPPRCRAAATG
ncbi:Crp/Fnr family transcriptional regulator [Sphingomonas flavalba]|uniref:Crp/Fnr family transcriptional regulator n=1 Tax=Sphingomonas flavalba TaxID=2559804 RepID=UPI0039E0D6FE